MQYKEFKPNNLIKAHLVFFGMLYLMNIVLIYYITSGKTIYYIIISIWFLILFIRGFLRYIGCVNSRPIIQIYQNRIEFINALVPREKIKIEKSDIKKVTRFTIKNNWIIGILLNNPDEFNKENKNKFVLSKVRKICLYLLGFFTLRKMFSFKKFISINPDDNLSTINILMNYNEKKYGCHLCIIEIYFAEGYLRGLLSPKQVKSDELFLMIKKISE